MPPTPSSPPKTSKRARWFFPLLIGSSLAMPALLFALRLEEDWRGQRAWDQYRTEALARGVKLNLTDFPPTQIPDDQNLAAIPLFQDAFTAAEVPGQTIPNPFVLPDKPKETPEQRQKRHQEGPSVLISDLTVWQKAFAKAKWIETLTTEPPRDVLAGLARLERPLTDLQHAADSRPKCRFPVRWEQGVAAKIPHFGILQNAVSALTLRCRARLALGQSAEAFRDLLLAFRLIHSTDGDPGVLPGLLRTSSRALTIQCIEDGLELGSWSDPQLAHIQETLTTATSLDDYRFGLESERASLNSIFETVAADRKKIFELGGQGASTSPAWIYPKGWVRLSQVRSHQVLDEFQARIDTSHGALRKNPSEPALDALHSGRVGWSKYVYMMSFIALPVYDTIEAKFAYDVAHARQAQTACALELYRRQHRTYPPALPTLQREFPKVNITDVCTGDPMRYRVNPSGYTLWSLGPNRIDDGGHPQPALSPQKQLDWVWKMP